MKRFLAIGALVTVAGCKTAGFRDGVFSKPGVKYAVSLPGAGWRAVSVDDNDLAWVSKTSEHSLAVDSTCDPGEDAPLNILTNHLLEGMTDRERLSQALEQLDGREAMRSRYRAKLDGVPIELELVVMKKDGCIYDFVYQSPPGRSDDKHADFDRLIRGFKTEPIS